MNLSATRNLTNNPYFSQWLNGLAVIPTLHALAISGALDGVPLRLDTESISLKHVLGSMTDAGDGASQAGVLAAFRTLALQGWLWLDDQASESRVATTRSGAEILALAKQFPEALAYAASSLRDLGELHNVLYVVDSAETRALAERLEALNRLSAKRWEITGLEGVNSRLIEQFRALLDGVLLCPTLVALAWGSQIGKQSPLEHLQDASTTARWEDMASDLNPAILVQCVRTLEVHGLVRMHDGRPVLTEQGILVSAEVANLGVITSYLPLLSRLQEILVGAKSPFNPADDTHVDRAMNIWGSSGSTVLRAVRGKIAEDVLGTLFDQLPLDQQPAGIADMGCGDGRALAEMGEYVIASTRRGKELAHMPLYLLGADPSPVSRSKAQATLARLSIVQNVVSRVVYGDVSDPEAYDRTIRKLDWNLRGASPLGATDFVHTQLFLLHDRSLRLQEREASEVMGSALAEVSPYALRDALMSRDLVIRNPPWTAEDLFAVESCVIDEFRTSGYDKGALIPGLVVALDLVALLKRWTRFSPFGLLLVEPHIPGQASGAAPPADDAHERLGIDPAPAVWAVHYASSQFLMTLEEYELALALAGLVPLRSWSTDTNSISMTWCVNSDAVYCAVPDTPTLVD